MLNVKKIIENF